MSKVAILLNLFQLFGPVMAEAWPLIKELLDYLKKAPQPRMTVQARARMARPDRVENAQKEELFRLADEHGVGKEELEEALA